MDRQKSLSFKLILVSNIYDTTFHLFDILGSPSRALEHPYFNQLRRDGAQFQEMRISAEPGEKHLNIVSCNPDAFKVSLF